MCDAPPLSQIIIVDFATFVRGFGLASADELSDGNLPRAPAAATSKDRRSIGDPAEKGSGSIVRRPPAHTTHKNVLKYPSGDIDPPKPGTGNLQKNSEWVDAE